MENFIQKLRRWRHGGAYAMRRFLPKKNYGEGCITENWKECYYYDRIVVIFTFLVYK